MKKIKLIVAALFMATLAQAQVVVKTEKGDMKLRISGRTNLDYGRFFNQSDANNYGFKMNDTRLGVSANFDEKWSAKMEICYASKAISFRDLWIGYDFNPSMWIKGGNQFQPFGAKPLGLAYKFIEDAQADYAICPGRKIGLAYGYVSNPFLGTVSVSSDGNVDAPAANQGYSVAAKAIGRPIMKDSTVLHFGVAGMYSESHNDVQFSDQVPVTFDSHKLMPSLKCVDSVTHNTNRLEVEGIFIHRRFYFEAHYLQAFVNLLGSDNFTAQGFYAQTSFLLIGKKQNYNKKTGLAAASSPKNLEILARYNWLKYDFASGNDPVKNDFTLGLNYFFNKNLNAKLNYVVSKEDLGDDNEHTNNAIQARLQFSF